jgi:hypothetical protein
MVIDDQPLASEDARVDAHHYTTPHHAGLRPAGFFNDYHLRLFSDSAVPATACAVLHW